MKNNLSKLVCRKGKKKKSEKKQVTSIEKFPFSWDACGLVDFGSSQLLSLLYSLYTTHTDTAQMQSVRIFSGAKAGSQKAKQVGEGCLSEQRREKTAELSARKPTADTTLWLESWMLPLRSQNTRETKQIVFPPARSSKNTVIGKTDGYFKERQLFGIWLALHDSSGREYKEDPGNVSVFSRPSSRCF